MTLYQNRYRVESTRLTGWDYAQAAWYFLTTVTRDRACLFGDIVNGQMELNSLGQIVESCWQDLPNHYPTMIPDAFVIMPNHVHMVIGLIDPRPVGIDAVGIDAGGIDAGGIDAVEIDAGNDGRIDAVGIDVVGIDAVEIDAGNDGRIDAVETGLRPVSTNVQSPKRVPVPPKHVPVSEIIRAFKSFSSRRINELRNTPGTPVWQARFHDRIIRDKPELNRIRRYIAQNPAKWDRDRNAQPHVIPAMLGLSADPTQGERDV